MPKKVLLLLLCPLERLHLGGAALSGGQTLQLTPLLLFLTRASSSSPWRARASSISSLMSGFSTCIPTTARHLELITLNWTSWEWAREMLLMPRVWVGGFVWMTAQVWSSAIEVATRHSLGPSWQLVSSRAATNLFAFVNVNFRFRRFTKRLM